MNTLELVLQVWGGCKRDYDSEGLVVSLLLDSSGLDSH